jgi:hypothetical protein
MKLPTLRVRLAPDGRCIRCCQSGYVEEKCRLCLGCLNIGILEYSKWKKRKLEDELAATQGRARAAAHSA